MDLLLHRISWSVQVPLRQGHRARRREDRRLGVRAVARHKETAADHVEHHGERLERDARRRHHDPFPGSGQRSWRPSQYGRGASAWWALEFAELVTWRVGGG
ncbi:hypothetical protein ACIPWY_40190 [Streptomyces sp. NPDC090032]|uniref:hypothetical protein n=1 Tax=Streptomyces sp. NPDC090032 TaxID=3365925 RepID=UPI00380DD348